MAAIVLEFGVDAQSPIANTFGNLTCCSVDGFTSTKPAAFDKPVDCSSKTEGTLCGGTACKIEYYKKENKTKQTNK